jgi:hypothetical protein
MRLAATGRVHSPETREKLSKIVSGRVAADETKAKLSKLKKGKPLSEAHKAALATAWVFRKKREEDAKAVAPSSTSAIL